MQSIYQNEFEKSMLHILTIGSYYGHVNLIDAFDPHNDNSYYRSKITKSYFFNTFQKRIIT
jgi:hypothetical protein